MPRKTLFLAFYCRLQNRMTTINGITLKQGLTPFSSKGAEQDIQQYHRWTSGLPCLECGSAKPPTAFASCWTQHGKPAPPNHSPWATGASQGSSVMPSSTDKLGRRLHLSSRGLSGADDIARWGWRLPFPALKVCMSDGTEGVCPPLQHLSKWTNRL